ncbi:hypothetical protein STA1M1_36910 [Sinisalibacter aestuarii]|uniref:TrgA family protein n=2 Tax=Sinisalibacter aestuarii TaxID=2949426 RepID=A0ABQ5LXX0_9RHOB|nr:hypothetical protein STA1M1_36910 [Sinisalibacter aestuarii]
MPTTARLVAAVLMAALGWGVATLATAYLPEGQPVGLFAPVMALWGVIVGWIWTGRKIQEGSGKPLGVGLVGAALLVFWVLLSFAGFEMVRRATRVRYGGPVEALEDMMKIAMEYVRDQMQPDVIGALVIGGALAGVLTAWVARRFR